MSLQETVYVVDDDPSVQKAASRLFRAAGLEVVGFESADQFLDYPVANERSCVILDYQMPGRNGIEIQEELRKRGVDVPIVFMTGHGDIPTSVLAMKQGAVDFLPKPVDDQKLILTVKKAIQDCAREVDRNKQVLAFKKSLESLTDREREVMNLVVEGLLNKQIAARLGVTESTIKVHRGRLMEKTGVESVAQLVRLHERASAMG